MRGTWQRVRGIIKKRGLFGTLSHGLKKVGGFLYELTPGRRRVRKLQEEASRAYDREHQVDTAGLIPLTRFNHPGVDHRSAFSYDPIMPETFRRIVGSLPIEHKDFVFIDLGSGKGRALLLASEFPFRRIIGVELVPQLHEGAERNFRSFKNTQQKCQALESVCTDVTAFTFPEGPLVVFLFNPFDENVMGKVVANLERSHQEQPRPTHVVYCIAVHDEVWGRSPLFEKVAGEPMFYSIYRARYAEPR